MPGKYSHSVVLADYSSRGLIALPNDQHIAYLRTAVYPPSSYSKSSTKGQSEVSLSASTRKRSQSNHSYQDQHSPTVPDLAFPRRHVRIDPAPRIEDKPKFGLGLNGQSRQQPMERRRSKSESSTGRKIRNTSTGNSHIGGDFHTNAIASHSTQPPVPQLPNPSSYGSPSPRKRSLEVKHVHYKEPETLVKQIPVSKIQPEPKTMPKVKSKTTNSTNPNPKPVPADVKKTVTKTIRRIDPLSAHPPKVENLRNKESTASITTQIYRPLSTIGEPDFDGFSDAEESQSSYFDQTQQPRATGKPDGGMGMLNSLRNTETPPPRHNTLSRNSQTRTLNSASTVPSERYTTVSPDDFHNKLDSLTSSSSLGSWGMSVGSPGKKQKEVRPSTSDGPSSQWQLPEIDELREFGPDLFMQGLDEEPKPVSSDLTFGESRLGMISSGRDFDADDAASLASAACPPNINRFREEDAAPAPYLTVTGRNSSEARAHPSPATTPSTTKKGIFSKLRSMSKTR